MLANLLLPCEPGGSPGAENMGRGRRGTSSHVDRGCTTGTVAFNIGTPGLKKLRSERKPQVPEPRSSTHGSKGFCWFGFGWVFSPSPPRTAPTTQATEKPFPWAATRPRSPQRSAHDRVPCHQDRQGSAAKGSQGRTFSSLSLSRGEGSLSTGFFF